MGEGENHPLLFYIDAQNFRYQTMAEILSVNYAGEYILKGFHEKDFYFSVWNFFYKETLLY